MSHAHPDLRIGHVHLKVSDLDRSVSFYRDVLGLEVMVRGAEVAFLSAGGYHHHIALNTWHSKGQNPAPRRAPGLYHTAFLYPDRKALADAVRRVVDLHIPIDGAADHGVSEAVYFNDPDGNGIELYRDRPRAYWPKTAQGNLRLPSKPLDVDALISLAEA